MSILTPFLTFCAFLTVFWCALDWVLRRRRSAHRVTALPFPPGPRGLPLVGNLFAFGKAPLTSLLDWSKKYGPIVGLRLGEFKAVVISDYTLLKEAFNNEAFNGRPEFRPALLFTGGESQGTLTSDGEPWDVIRRFTVKSLNALGFGKRSMESFISDNADALCQELQAAAVASEHGSVDLHDRFYLPVSSNLWYILTGEELDLKNNESRMKQALVRLNNALWQPIGSAIWFYPSLTKWFPQATEWTTLTEAIRDIKKLLGVHVDEHKRAHPQRLPEEPTSDLITAYLDRLRSAEMNPGSHFHAGRGLNHMNSMVLNLFVTAAEAMSNTLSWAVLYLSLYPRVQEKLYTEIVRVLGPDRSPTQADQSNMPYTRAVMQELLRIASTSPFSNFQSTTRDVDFHGYRIPKDTVVIGNLYAIHHDPALWSDPEVFRPERFLEGADADATKPTPPTIPFSVGLRTCLGQTYAKMELFLFMVRLVQKFQFGAPVLPCAPGGEGGAWTADYLTSASRVSIFRFCPEYKATLSLRKSGTRCSWRGRARA